MGNKTSIFGTVSLNVSLPIIIYDGSSKNRSNDTLAKQNTSPISTDIITLENNLLATNKENAS